jgi:hypothetical protein
MGFASWFDNDFVGRQSFRLWGNIQRINWFILKSVDPVGRSYRILNEVKAVYQPRKYDPHISHRNVPSYTDSSANAESPVTLESVEEVFIKISIRIEGVWIFVLPRIEMISPLIDCKYRPCLKIIPFKLIVFPNN